MSIVWQRAELVVNQFVIVYSGHLHIVHSIPSKQDVWASKMYTEYTEHRVAPAIETNIGCVELSAFPRNPSTMCAGHISFASPDIVTILSRVLSWWVYTVYCVRCVCLCSERIYLHLMTVTKIHNIISSNLMLVGYVLYDLVIIREWRTRSMPPDGKGANRVINDFYRFRGFYHTIAVLPVCSDAQKIE